MIVLASGGLLPAPGQRVSIDAALHPSDKPYIEASGDATVLAKPDQAFIEIGVVTQGATVLAAASQNAKDTDAVLKEMRSLLGAGAKVRTTSYSVRSNFRYPKPGAAPAITGYSATNVVEITFDDLDQVSKVIDSATQSGANSIQKLQYRLKNRRSVRAQALREAAEEAKASVDAIAAGLGVKVIRVMSAGEAFDEDFGMKKSAMVAPPPMAPSPPTPIEVGMIEVQASVMLRAEISQ